MRCQVSRDSRAVVSVRLRQQSTHVTVRSADISFEAALYRFNLSGLLADVARRRATATSRRGGLEITKRRSKEKARGEPRFLPDCLPSEGSSVSKPFRERAACKDPFRLSTRRPSCQWDTQVASMKFPTGNMRPTLRTSRKSDQSSNKSFPSSSTDDASKHTSPSPIYESLSDCTYFTHAAEAATPL